MPPTGGYIKLYRSILEHPLWKCTPPAWWRVAQAILLTASWKSSKWWDGRREIQIPAGGLVSSRKSMCELARVTSREYRDAVDYLVKTEFCDQQTTNRYTILTVRNWELYQGDAQAERPTNDQPATNKRPASDQPATTSEEGKKLRREEAAPTPTPSPGTALANIQSSELRFDAFWQIFVRAGKPLSEDDKVLTLREWLSLTDESQNAAFAYAADQVLNHWSSPEFTPLPQNYLHKKSWTRVAAQRTVPLPPQRGAMRDDAPEIARRLREMRQKRPTP
jgi:biotin carboxyl carrier protein